MGQIGTGSEADRNVDGYDVPLYFYVLLPPSVPARGGRPVRRVCCYNF
jgi:hypothetical protein